MARWRKKLFIAIARNAANPVALLPPPRRPHGRDGARTSSCDGRAPRAHPLGLDRRGPRPPGPRHRRRPAPGAPGHPRAHRGRAAGHGLADRSRRAGRGADGVSGPASSSSTPSTGSTRRWRPRGAWAAGCSRRWAARGCCALIAAERPDIVVSTYPGVTEVLGRLRRQGRLDVPVVSAITDLAGLRYWAHPGVDLHLVIHPESIEEVRAIAPASRIVWANGMWSPAFLQPRDRGRRAPRPRPAGRRTRRRGLRRRLGVGDLEGAVEAALRVDGATSCACAGATRRCARAWPRASRARAACARSASPTRWATGWRRPTRSSTRPPG